MRASVLISIIFLAACSVANNKIGFGVSYDKPLRRECVIESISATAGVTDLKISPESASFKLSKYKVTFLHKIENHSVTGYQIDIDGMFLGEDTAEFYRNAENLQKSLHKRIEQGCY